MSTFLEIDICLSAIAIASQQSEYHCDQSVAIANLRERIRHSSNNKATRGFKFMSNQLLATNTTFAELFGHIAYSKIITSTQKQDLITARKNATLSDEDRHSIDRLLYGLRRGWLQVVE